MNNDELQSILTIVFIFLTIILFVAICILIWIVLKEKLDKKNHNKKKTPSQENNLPKEVHKEYSKQSIFKFMEFDTISDNMIVQKNGKRFLMVIECQGINFDLMSGLEKNSVEQGFVQFLNALRYPIQIYVQTRTVNLGGSIENYKERVNNIAKAYRDKQNEYKRMSTAGTYTDEQLNKERYDLARQKNLYEYGVDIVSNTERMSLNKNILSKHYYIIIPHYVEENPDVHYAKEEIANIAFSELYTKAQTIINSLAVCGISGKVLDSIELMELLYVAYNRDESEVFDLRRALNAGYEDLYSTAPDIYEKRIKELNKKIREEAEIKANEFVNEAIEETEKQKQARLTEERINFLITDLTKSIIKDNEKHLGKEVTKKAIEKADKEISKEEKTNEKKGESVNEKAKKSTRK